MKKIIISLIAVLAATTIIACGTKATVAKAPTKEFNTQNYPLKGSHLESLLECADCHGDDTTYKMTVRQDACLSCHGSYEDLAKKTEKLGYDDNIHASPHYPKMDCDLCHKIHEPKPTKTVYCAACHSQKTMLDLVAP